jgi:hypothetical protein
MKARRHVVSHYACGKSLSSRFENNFKTFATCNFNVIRVEFGKKKKGKQFALVHIMNIIHQNLNIFTK